ncbi:hypothetical protein ABZP36_029852 [Zizania latifolia]
MGATISRCFCLPRRGQPLPTLPSPALEEEFCGLTDDILEEIFLRLLAHHGCLRRVSLACKQFHRVVTSRRFIRRFRATHLDAPPLFGLFHNYNHGDSRFIPVGVDGTGYCFAPDNDAGQLLVSGETDWNVIDCRGGLVLLQTKNRLRLLVLEPMVGRRHYLPPPSDKSLDFCNAAVISTYGADDDHDDFNSHSFQVVFVSNNLSVGHPTTVYIYTSQTGHWRNAASANVSSVVKAGRPSVLIRGVLYWQLIITHGIIAFNLETHELYEIVVPVDMFEDIHDLNVNIVAPKSGGLGLTAVAGYAFQMWTRHSFPDVDAFHADASSWELRKIVRLDALLPLRNARFGTPAMEPGRKRPPVWIMGIDEEQNVGFVWTRVGVFALDIDTMKFRKEAMEQR